MKDINHSDLLYRGDWFLHQVSTVVEIGKKKKDHYDEEAAYESYTNPEPGIQFGPGGSVDAD